MTPDPALGDPATGPAGRYIYEPDGAAIRAHLVAEIAAAVGGRLLDPQIAYITGDTATPTPWASRYEVHETLPFSLKRLRAALRERGAGNVTIKSAAPRWTSTASGKTSGFPAANPPLSYSPGSATGHSPSCAAPADRRVSPG